MVQFALFQEEYGSVDPDVLVPILQTSGGLVRHDAVRIAHERAGILAEHLEHDRAEGVRQALLPHDGAVRLIPQELVIRLGRPHRVRLLRLTDAAFEVQWGYSGGFESIPWDHVFLLSAGEIQAVDTVLAESQRRRSFQEVVRRGRLSRSRELQFLKALTSRIPGLNPPPFTYRQMLADVFATDCAGTYRHIRLLARDLYYDQILGTAAQPDYFANFRTVLAQLADRAGEALVTEETLALLGLSSDPDADSYFGDDACFTSYNRWVFQWLLLEQLKQNPAGGELPGLPRGLLGRLPPVE